MVRLYISKKVYENIGTHESVKAEIVEDGALGQKIKDSGYRLRMFRGEKIISAYWARIILFMEFIKKINYPYLLQ